MKNLNNQFIVSLGDIELSDAQRVNIDNAIQKAVLKELSVMDNINKLLVKRPIGGIGKIPDYFPWGIIIWKNPKLPLETIIKNSLEQLQMK